MAVQKLLALSGAKRKEIVPVTSSAGAADGGKIAALDLTTGKWHPSLLPAGVGPEIRSIMTSEALIIGPVNIYNNAGTLNVRKADATSEAKKADGFVLQSYLSGVLADVYIEDGIISGLVGLTIGAEYFLGDTPGTIVAAAGIPTVAGHIIQPLGKALSATELQFIIGDTDELS